MFFKKDVNIALSLISSKLKKNYTKVIFFNIINVFLDILTLVTIYPLVSTIIGKNVTKIDTIIINIISYLGLNLENKLTYIFYFFIFVILIKNLILIYIKFETVKVIEKVFKEVSEKLYLNTLSKNYLYFSSFKKPVLLKNLREIPIEFKNYLDVYLNYYVCILNIVIITCSLIFFNFKITAFILIYIFITTLFYKFLFSNKAKNWGIKGNTIAGKIYTNILDTINLIHEIKLHDKFYFFYKKHINLSNTWSNFVFLNKFISSVSRPLFEIFLILPLFFIAIIFSNILINVNILPILSVYIYAAFRVLPSLVNLNISKLRQQNHLFAVDYLNTEFENFNQKINYNKLKNKQDIKKIKFNKNLKLQKIYFKFPKSKNFLIEDLNLEINRNDFIGIKGESGVGKSSLIKIILGLIPPTDGKIILDDEVNMLDVKSQYMNLISYVSQNLSLLNDTILNNVAFGVEKDKINIEAVWNSLSLASAEDFTRKLDKNLDFVVSNDGQNLSGGQAQRIAIARALYHKPEIIILDEATNSLDVKTEKSFYDDLLKLKGNVTIINISHKNTSLEFCDKIYELSNNQIKEIKN